ncbi:MAG TPA: SIR2 family protein, partial [Microthrixaceae bacterium]|nr:SIR2 family protein [Microthrixaceae bacterium]
KVEQEAREQPEKDRVKHGELLREAESGDPEAVSRLNYWKNYHPSLAVAPVVPPDPLSLVYGRARAAAARNNPTALIPVIDLEDVVTLLLELAGRSTSALGEFVTEWDAELSEVDHQTIGMLSHQRIGEQYDWAMVRFVESVVEARLSQGSGRPFKKAVKRIIEELPKHLEFDPANTGYLDPIGRWAERHGPVTIATLNYDQTIETMCERIGVTCSDGYESWTNNLVLDWGECDLRLLKLHGSVNWTTRDREPSFLLGGTNKLTAAGPFLDLLAEMRHVLMQAARVVVIGYSFRDDHVNAVLKRLLAHHDREETPFRIDVVDPGLGDLDTDTMWRPSFWRSLIKPDQMERETMLERVGLHSMSAEDFLKESDLSIL